MVLDEQQRQIGKDNFDGAVRITRRQMLTGAIAVPSAAAAYWGYGKLEGDPVKVGIIGTGAQACNAHIPQSNKDYIRFVAFSDIRPSNQARARRLFNEKYGAAAKDIKLYTDYHDLINDENVEMVIVVLPLHLHKAATVAALEAGKPVLCEKLMARTVTECKQMVQAADEAKQLLAIGHQRHYSYLYHNALAIIQQKLLGDIRYIRAYWHRNQTKGDSWKPDIPEQDRLFFAGKEAKLDAYGYPEGLRQLVQWRIDPATGGGLMVELGSHQLDAASIFLNKAHPHAVLGTGVTSYLMDWAPVSDHIFLNFEFGEDAHHTVVTYSSISTNEFDGYGEQVMGSKGTMIVQKERSAYVFREPKYGGGADTRIDWAEARLERPVTDSGSTMAWGTGVGTADTLTSRGYREEQEHMAWLIRHPDKIQWPSEANDFHPDLRFFPRCHARVALADAVIALTANIAMKVKQRIVFKPEWFDPYNEAAPEIEYADEIAQADAGVTA